MSNKQWSGADASYFSAADWSPSGVPGTGDTASITAGSVAIANATIAGVAITLTASAISSPRLTLDTSTLDGNTTLTLAGGPSTPTLTVLGTDYNNGTISLSSNDASAVIALPGTALASKLVNQGRISINGNASIILQSTAYATALTNNGTVQISNTFGGNLSTLIQVAVNGTGTIDVGNGSYTIFGQGIGAGQTIQFGSGAETVQLNAAGQSSNSYSGFGSGSRIALAGVTYDSVTYTATANAGNLVFSSSGAVVDTLHFNGAYDLNSFSVSTQTSGGTPFTLVNGNPVRVSYTDTTTNINGSDPATAYSGPVSYLQWQYLWPSTDGVAIAASADSIFLRGNTGSDALSVHGGNNVIDGGGGSDFITGGTGADGGTDTFFIDGRGGVVTWSSIVNFHHGDAVTIFGFKAGVSTLPFTPVDGAQGYQGATIHSELNGAGTGVNGSVTFAGVSLADAQSKFTISNGTVGGTDYLYIQYTG